MKYLIVFFLVAMTLQPAALSACAMDGDHDASPHASMQHANHVSGHSMDNPGHDCCEPENDDAMQDCDARAHCTSGTTGFAAIPPAASSVVQSAVHQYRFTQDQRLTAPPGPPLLRPPIA